MTAIRPRRHHVPDQTRCIVESPAKPQDVSEACADELRLEVLPAIVRAAFGVGAGDLVHDRAISVEQSTSQGQEASIRHVYRANGQALLRSDAYRDEPTMHRDIADLGPVVDVAFLSSLDADRVRLGEASEKDLDKLAVRARERDRSPADETPICRDQTYRVRERLRPCWIEELTASTTSVLFRRDTCDVLLAPMRGRRPRDPRIVHCGSTLRPALALTSGHSSCMRRYRESRQGGQAATPVP